MKKGYVYLVGAGPGDVGLLTLKGFEAISQAEVILYDRLANPKLLDFAPQDCELIYCGKLPDRHILRQERINEILAEKALEGKRVVRLKGGDPGVFGRVGEEAEALVRQQISYEIIPGVTSGIAAPLYAGIPVTHRQYAESFAVVTAHDKSTTGKPLLDWEALARGVDTIAFYMGVGNLPYICENLVKYGKPADTPVILIRWGTFSRQTTLAGTLNDICEKAEEVKFSNPSIILVGKVASLRKKINWFEKKPLFGKQILLVRTGTGKSQLAKELMDHGADVIEFPKWRKTALPLDSELLGKLPDYEKVLFTSPESVSEFLSAVIQMGMDIRRIKAQLFGGSVKSIKALNEYGLTAELAEKMPEAGSMLIVGDDSILKTDFSYKSFDLLAVSKKEIDPQFYPIFKRMLEEAEINTVIFPCKAAVKILLEGFKQCDIGAEDFLKEQFVVCMGQQTWAAAAAAGLNPSGMPEAATSSALLENLAQTKEISR